jgi:hypothetical protein
MLAVVMNITFEGRRARPGNDLQRVVLRRIENLQEGRGRIAPESLPNLSISSSMKTGLFDSARRIPG